MKGLYVNGIVRQWHMGAEGKSASAVSGCVSPSASAKPTQCGQAEAERFPRGYQVGAPALFEPA